MEMKTFSTLYVARLTVENVYALNQSTIEIATGYKEYMSDLQKAVFTQFVDNNAVLGEQMNKQSKSVTISMSHRVFSLTDAGCIRQNTTAV